MKTGSEYRHANKLRVQNHRQSMEARGYKAKTVFLSDKFHETLKQVCREQRLPQHEVFDLILEGYLKSLDKPINGVFGSVNGNVDEIDHVDTTGVDVVAAEIQETLDDMTTTLKPVKDSLPNLEPEQDHSANGKGKDSKQLDMFDPDKVVVDPEPPIDLAFSLEDYHGKTLSTPEKDKIMLQINEALPGRKNAAKRVELLNNAGIPCGNKGIWTTKKFTDNLRHVRERQGDK